MTSKTKSINGKGNVEWTRQQLINAAARQFAMFGYEGASLRNIREQVDVQNSTIHYHFGSKEGLYKAVTEHLGLSFTEFVDGLRVHKTAPTIERFCLFVESMQNWGAEHQDFTSIIIREMLAKQLHSADSSVYRDIGATFRNVSEFIKGDDNNQTWRAVDWDIFTLNLVFAILTSQAISIAIPLTYGLDEHSYKDKQKNELLVDQLLSLAKNPQAAREHIRVNRPDIVIRD